MGTKPRAERAKKKQPMSEETLRDSCDIDRANWLVVSCSMIIVHGVMPWAPGGRECYAEGSAIRSVCAGRSSCHALLEEAIPNCNDLPLACGNDVQSERRAESHGQWPGWVLRQRGFQGPKSKTSRLKNSWRVWGDGRMPCPINEFPLSTKPWVSIMQLRLSICTSFCLRKTLQCDLCSHPFPSSQMR